MQRYLLALSLMLALITTSTHAGWFDQEEKQRRIETEQQLAAQREQTDNWQIIAGSLAVVVVVAFTIGTVLGSRTRKKGGESK